MPKPTAKFLSAIAVNVLAGLPLAAMAQSETATAEGCLSSPKDETPAGSHWYYRVDHATKRNCWYLRPQGSKVSQAQSQSDAPASSPPAKSSVSNARAELRNRPDSDTNSADNDPRANAPVNSPENTGAVSSPADPVTNDTNPSSASVWDAPTPPPAAASAPIATRWPEQLPPARSMPSPAPITASASSDASQSPADQPQAPEVAAASASIADSSAPVQPETILTLIAGTLGALAFAGAAALISRRRRKLHLRHRDTGHGVAWDTADGDRMVLPDDRLANNRDYRPRFARGVGSVADTPSRRPAFSPRKARAAAR